MLLSIITTVTSFIFTVVLGVLWYVNRKAKCTTRKRFTLIFAFIFVISIPFLINELYKNGGGYITVWGAKEVLSFYGAFLTFLGTIALGALALWQNERFKRENDKAQKRLQYLNEQVLKLDSAKEKQRLLELYFSFVEAAGKIYDVEYVIGNFDEKRGDVETYFVVKKCKSECLSIRRRLLFLDKDNSDNAFFTYALGKIDEISSITMSGQEEEGQIIMKRKLLQFMRENSTEFERKSPQFICEIYITIFEKEPLDEEL